ncbi:MAG: fibronectin type III domain-containing protein [bacterium]
MNLISTAQAGKSLKTFITIGVLAVAALGVAKGGQYVYTTYVGAGAESTPQQVKADTITANSAVISWNTSKESFGFVEYGSTPELGLSAQSSLSEKTLEHSAALKNLLPNTKYYYKIGSGAESFGQGEGDTPYSFVTLASGGQKVEEPEEDATTVTEAGFDKYMYTADPLYDLNKDGEVNSIDYELFKSR